MEFTIKDRILFYQKIQDVQGFVSTLVKDSLKSKLKLSIEEIDECNIRDTENGIEWDKPHYVKDIMIYKSELDILKGIVEQLDEDGEIDFSMVNICSEIMG